MDLLPSPMTNIFTVRSCQLLCEQAIEHEKNRTEDSKELRGICQGIGREPCRAYGKRLKLSTAVLDNRNEINRGFDKLRGQVGGSETNMDHRFHGVDAGIARIDMRLDATSEWLRSAIDAKIDVFGPPIIRRLDHAESISHNHLCTQGWQKIHRVYTWASDSLPLCYPLTVKDFWTLKNADRCRSSPPVYSLKPHS